MGPVGSTTSVSIVVAGVTEISRGPAGQPVEVATNTGCSPKAWNKFYVRSAGGVTPASAALVKTVLAASYGGDWRPIGEQHAFGG